MPIIISAQPMKNLKSIKLYLFIILCVINVIINVIQLTNGLAILKSLAPIRKLFKIDPS